LGLSGHNGFGWSHGSGGTSAACGGHSPEQYTSIISPGKTYSSQLSKGGETDGVIVGVTELVGVGPRGVAVAVIEGEGGGVPAGVELGVMLGVGPGVDVGVFVIVLVGVDVLVTVGVRVGDAAGVDVGSLVGVGVGVIEEVGTGVSLNCLKYI
jgi:hypothetical protein